MSSPLSTTNTRENTVLKRAFASPLAAVAFVAALVVLSGWLRSRSISTSFWMDEALSVGISSHDLMDIPHVLRHDGSPPLYYMLLSVWMGAFGRTEAATHALSLVAALACVPLGAWTGWRLFDRRTGLILATLLAVSVFLTQYAEETRMYTLMALLSLGAVASFCLAFVDRRRRWLPVFSVLLAAMLYTHGWGIFFGMSSAIASLYLVKQSNDRKPLVIDGLLAFGFTALLYLPWLPTLVYQAGHTGAPWSSSPRLGVFSQVSTLLGGWGTAAALVVGASMGLTAIWLRRPLLEGPGVLPADADPERTRTLLVAILVIITGTLAIAWTASQFNPAWTQRYMAAVICPILLVLAVGAARSGVVGLVGTLAAVSLALVAPVNATMHVKSNVRDIAAGVRSDLRPGDLVINGQPEQVPLSWYYMPGGLHFADPMGRTSDPRMLNWVHVVARLQAADPAKTYERLMATVPNGTRILLVRPLTITRSNWVQSWTQLIRLR
ncbi:MAG: glycosyltransferase family 39 protein, partial [Solirubrobacterales bacterium]|nr:glycosyltransferase family 39 protein [Solirubrobacterales bacterium]